MNQHPFVTMSHEVSRRVLLGALGLASISCLDRAPTGQGNMELRVAALTLPGVANACYDLRVSTASDTVWRKGDPLATRAGTSQLNRANPAGSDQDTICSDTYGNSAGGDITYIGPCDSSADADTLPGAGNPGTQNEVTVWVDGLYDPAGDDVGEWQDPCPPAGCTIAFTCDENSDTLAEFNFTIMRDANQGFFDIGVNFEDIFCSAKFDTCYGDDEIELLHAPDGTRAWTGVFGFACSAGTDATSTNLLYGLIQVDCGSAGLFVIDPTADAGTSSAPAGDHALSYGNYRGVEQLDCGSGAGSCKKVYWNLALSLDDLIRLNADCTLSFSATANDDNDGFSAGLPTTVGLAYPYIDVLVPLTSARAEPFVTGIATCQEHALDGSDTAVTTSYKGSVDGLDPAPPMCSQFDGEVSVTGADCAPVELCEITFEDRQVECDVAWLDAATDGYNAGESDASGGCVRSLSTCCSGDGCYGPGSCASQCGDTAAAYAEGYNFAYDMVGTCPPCE